MPELDTSNLNGRCLLGYYSKLARLTKQDAEITEFGTEESPTTLGLMLSEETTVEAALERYFMTREWKAGIARSELIMRIKRCAGRTATISSQPENPIVIAKYRPVMDVKDKEVMVGTTNVISGMFDAESFSKDYPYVLSLVVPRNIGPIRLAEHYAYVPAVDLDGRPLISLEID